jgi:hypothetical protein
VPGVSQAGAWRTKHSLLMTNYEPNSPSRRAGDRSDEKLVIVRGALKGDKGKNIESRFQRFGRLALEAVGDRSGVSRWQVSKVKSRLKMSRKGKRGKTGGGMNIRFPGRHESDSLWECRRLQTLIAFHLPI